ncbi:MAG: copper resistance CopC/CopD family protein [Gemmatimonadaceae bacterium]
MTKRLRVLLALVMLLVPARAWAHAHLRRSEPAAGSRLTAPPLMIRLWFSEQPELSMTFASLKDSTGREVPLGSAGSGATAQLQIAFRVLGTLSPGRYTLTWRTAASDGHPSHGKFIFTVLGIAGTVPGAIAPPVVRSPVAGDSSLIGEPSTTPTNMEEESDGASSLGNSIARALEFVSLLALIGAVTFRSFVLPRARAVAAQLREKMAIRAAWLGLISGVALILVGLGRLGLELQMMNAMPDMPTMTGMSAKAMVMHTAWGFAFYSQLIAASVALAAFALAIRSMRGAWSAAVVAAIVLAATPAFAGHAAASPRFTSLMIAGDLLHVLGGSSWLGTLLAVMLIGVPIALTLEGAARWSSVESLVEAFSPLALISAALVFASGIFASWIHLERFSALWRTSYGEVLIVKLLLVAITLGIGAYNFKRVQPELSTERGTWRLRRSAALELGAGLLILLVTGLLTGISP